MKAAELRAKFLAARADLFEEAEEAGLLNPRRRGGRYGDKFLTLTAPHISTDTIASRIERVFGAWKVFLRTLNDYLRERGIKRVEWLRVLEWTPGDSDQHGHPHLHVWLFAPYLEQDMIRDLWWRALLASGCSREECVRPIVDIRPMTDPLSGALELVKYLTKDIEANGTRLDPDAYAQVINVLDGRRQTQCSRGFMTRARKGPLLCEQCHSGLPKIVQRRGRPGNEAQQ